MANAAQACFASSHPGQHLEPSVAQHSQLSYLFLPHPLVEGRRMEKRIGNPLEADGGAVDLILLPPAWRHLQGVSPPAVSHTPAPLLQWEGWDSCSLQGWVSSALPVSHPLTPVLEIAEVVLTDFER